MKQFRATFIKIQKVIAGQNAPVIMAEQMFETEDNNIIIPVPNGFALMSVCEILPPYQIKPKLHVAN